ncbi:MAG: aminotransferase class I/II-fold pyridoxal phosphate-dependent enzyme [Lamprobacter sp.]|uniref:aminotransferase class I/II-fold pyridoxal phosphate-dependent enzyme n=1 Tax=Lamprobacter sp. TaxID=3100796 RepID=UPI002B25814C|nr:aminotransferase class I/II-fold pyridoxal phosphate-dependent enzyme [Lamprobacter sp.]MEA3640794.1 aminotransferase class I/II-fold pyridoxal phosphate-dependent enzyme [Lamprobacter sp.]
MPLAQRIPLIQPFHVMEVLAKAQALEQAGRDVIHLEIGEPDFPTPEPIVARAQAALQAGQTRYTAALGLPELRALIAAHYPTVARPNPERVALVPGSSAALLVSFALLLDPGDEVLLADPGYPCNANFIQLFGGVPVRIPCGPETGYQLTPELIRAHWTERTRAVLLGSPANPTGSVIEPELMSAIAASLRHLGGTLVVDEIYQGLVYDGPIRSALHDGDDVFVINSFSKFYGMTGWRLGWLVAPEAYVDAVTRLCQNLFISAPTVSQYAALAAFEPTTLAELEWRRQAFQQRRDFLVPALRQLGFQVPRVPAGAFYVYADASDLTDDSQGFADQVLEQTGVALTPGRDFGDYRQLEHLRFSYAAPLARLEEAVERLRQWLV